MPIKGGPRGGVRRGGRGCPTFLVTLFPSILSQWFNHLVTCYMIGGFCYYVHRNFNALNALLHRVFAGWCVAKWFVSYFCNCPNFIILRSERKPPWLALHGIFVVFHAYIFSFIFCLFTSAMQSFEIKLMKRPIWDFL